MTEDKEELIEVLDEHCEERQETIQGILNSTKEIENRCRQLGAV